MSIKSYSSSGDNIMSKGELSFDFSFDEKDLRISNVSNSTILSTTTESCK